MLIRNLSKSKPVTTSNNANNNVNSNVNNDSILVIGYGNSLRSDDGAGCRVADIVASWELPYVRSLTVHQLTPELAEPISQAELAIFVDACMAASPKFRKARKHPKTLQVQKIVASREVASDAHPNLGAVGHVVDPRSLLSLAEQIYGKTPVAYALLLPAVNWEFGEQLSAVTRKSIDQAVDFLQNLCTKLVSFNQC
jgi:hydrogenase maturation protease